MFSCKSLNLVADGGGAKILKDINVALPTHALSAVIGPSGCGKTTLVKSFLRLNEATGECRFAGERIFQTLRIRKIHIRILATPAVQFPGIRST